MLKKMILSVVLVFAVGSLAEAACGCRATARSRTVSSNRVTTVQTPAPVAKPAPKPVPKVENKTAAPVAAPVVLTSGCESGRCRTVTSSRFRLFR